MCVDKPRLTRSGFRLVLLLLLFSRLINIFPAHIYVCVVGVRFISQRRDYGIQAVGSRTSIPRYIIRDNGSTYIGTRITFYINGTPTTDG